MRVDRLTRVHTIDGLPFARRVPSTQNGTAGWTVYLRGTDGREVRRFFRGRNAEVSVGGYIDRLPAGCTESQARGESLNALTFAERQSTSVVTGGRIPHSRKTRYVLSGDRASNTYYGRSC